MNAIIDSFDFTDAEIDIDAFVEWALALKENNIKSLCIDGKITLNR